MQSKLSKYERKGVPHTQPLSTIGGVGITLARSCSRPGAILVPRTQTRRSVGGCRAVYARMDMSSIPATTLRPCRVNVCVYCEPAYSLVPRPIFL